jgi:putative long chain acyl-CoA synthase
VQVLDSMPVTTWYRPLTAPLREAGIPEPGEGKQAWYLDRGGKTYRPLTATARRRLWGKVA